MSFVRPCIVLSLSLLLAGCINISTRFQPDDLTVKEELQGSDCVPIIFSIGIGTAELEKAKLGAKRIEFQSRFDSQKKQGGRPTIREPENITKVRRVEINDLMFLFIGAKCVDVVGEP
jgi:hypothetical protein